MCRAALAVPLALLTMAPVAARAKAPPPGYAVLKLGGYFPWAGDLGGFDASLVGELSLGRTFDRGFAVEGSVGSFVTKGQLDSSSGTVDRKLRVVPLSFTLRGTAPMGDFEPYALAGLGVYFVRDELSGPVLSTSGATSKSSANLGFHLGAGATFAFTRALLVGLEAKHHVLRATTFDRNTRLDGTVLTVGIGYRF